MESSLNFYDKLNRCSLKCRFFFYSKDLKSLSGKDQVPKRFYDMVNLFNYFNSFVNPIFYALRIAEFRRALALCCTGRHVQAAVNTKLSKRRKERHGTTAEFSRELAFEQDVMDTKM